MGGPQYYRVVSYIRGKDWLNEDVGLRISQGIVLAAASWILSGWSILATVGYVFGVAGGGGGETPDFVLVGLWIVILASIGLSAYTERLLKRRIVLFFPIATSVVVFVLLYVVFPYVACQRYTCIAAGSHP